MQKNIINARSSTTMGLWAPRRKCWTAYHIPHPTLVREARRLDLGTSICLIAITFDFVGKQADKWKSNRALRLSTRKPELITSALESVLTIELPIALWAKGNWLPCWLSMKAQWLLLWLEGCKWRASFVEDFWRYITISWSIFISSNGFK